MLEQIIFSDFWQYQVFGNSIKAYAATFFALLAFLLVFAIFQQYILSRLQKLAEKTKTDIDDALIEIVKSIKPPFYFFLSFWLAINFLTFADFVKNLINITLMIWVTYQVINAIHILLDYIATRRIKEESAKKTIEFAAKIAKAILWAIGVLLILSNLGVNVTSLIAGLGIGGVAVALALQNILGDLFSSFAIFFDKPFVVGDFIAVGNIRGEVEKIGIKTTRLRSLKGEEVVISNRELTSAIIHNFKKMERRRVNFQLTVTYNTPVEKLKKIPKIIERIIKSIKLAEFDRAHFMQLGDSALIYEIVYYVKTREYVKYADTSQEINLKIKGEFEKEKIEFAFPTQTIYLEK